MTFLTLREAVAHAVGLPMDFRLRSNSVELALREEDCAGALLVRHQRPRFTNAETQSPQRVRRVARRLVVIVRARRFGLVALLAATWAVMLLTAWYP
jgi:hypothetical protein